MIDILLQIFALAWIAIPCMYLYSCCCNCTIEEQNFDGASSTPTGYSEEVGTWAYADDVAKASTSGAILIFDTTVSVTYYRVYSKVKGRTNGDIVGVIGGYSNSSNFYSAELEFHDTNDGTLKLYKEVAGSRTELGSVDVDQVLTDLDEEVGVVLCFSDGDGTNPVVHAFIGSPTSTGSDYVITAADGSLSLPGKAGIYAQTVGGSAVEFDDFTISRAPDSDATCPSCAGGCNLCTHGDSGSQVQIVLADVATGLFLCADCADLNTTYTLDFVDECKWEVDVSDLVCDLGVLRYEISSAAPLSNWLATVTMTDSGGGVLCVWKDAPFGWQIDSDDFDRANSTNIGADWSEESGDWSINTNQLVVDDDGAIASWAGGGVPDDYYVIADVITAAGQEAGVLLWFTDTDNYYAATIDDNADLYIYRRSGGVTTTLATAGDNITGSHAVTFTITKRGDGTVRLTMEVDTLGVVLSVVDNNPIAEGDPGLYVKTANGSNVEFDDFSFGAFDCQLTDQEIPYLSSSGECNWNGSTATVTTNV